MQRKREIPCVIAIVAFALVSLFATSYFETLTCGGRRQIDDTEALRIAKRGFGSDATFFNTLGFTTFAEFQSYLDGKPNCCELIRKGFWIFQYWEASFTERRDDKAYSFALQVDGCGTIFNSGWVVSN